MQQNIMKKTIPESWFEVVNISNSVARYTNFEVLSSGDGKFVVIQCMPLDDRLVLCEVAKTTDYRAVREIVCIDGKRYERLYPVKVISMEGGHKDG